MKDEKVEKILEAAKKIFSRFGFKRATMGEIAEAVNMSRPALYLVFPSKEEILKAVISAECQASLNELQQNLPTIESEKEKLMFAFEVWSVRPFEMVQSFPDTRDLLESSYVVAGEVVTKAFAEFEKIVEDILEPLITSRSNPTLSSKQLAHILTSAIHGFKNAAGNVAELRQLFNDLITVILTSIQNSNESSKSK
jgi:AcrR family transcriptional regulator